MAKTDDILLKVTDLAREFHDYKETSVKKLDSIEAQVKATNGTVQHHEAKLKEHDGLFINMPWNKKWFWGMVLGFILLLAGVTNSELGSIILKELLL